MSLSRWKQQLRKLALQYVGHRLRVPSHYLDRLDDNSEVMKWRKLFNLLPVWACKINMSKLSFHIFHEGMSTITK